MKRFLIGSILLSLVSIASAQVTTDRFSPDLYQPPPCVGFFQDMPCPNFYTDYAEQLYRERITIGCNVNPLLFCPDTPIPRSQIAVWLLRLEDRIRSHFASGGLGCGNAIGNCKGQITDSRIHADSIVLIQYESDLLARPSRVWDIKEGSFRFELQNNTNANWFAYTPF